MYIANMNKVEDAMIWLNVNNPLYANGNVKLTDSIHDPSQISIINMACHMKDSSTAPAQCTYSFTNSCRSAGSLVHKILN